MKLVCSAELRKEHFVDTIFTDLSIFTYKDCVLFGDLVEKGISENKDKVENLVKQAKIQRKLSGRTLISLFSNKKNAFKLAVVTDFTEIA